MANDCCAGIYIPLDDANFKPIVVHDEKEFRKEVLNKNPNAAMVNPDILEGVSNAESEGSDESDIQ